MSIASNQAVTRQDIIDRFNTRIKDWVGTHVTIPASQAYTGSYRVWDGTAGWQEHSTHPSNTLTYTVVRTLNTTAGAIAANSTTHGGATNSTLTNDPVPTEAITPVDFSAAIGIKGTTVGHVTSVMKSFLKQYSKIHATSFLNIGNLVPNGWPGLTLTGVTKGTTIPEVSSANMDSDIELWMEMNNLKSGSTINPTQFIDFIEQCRTIWYNRCINNGVLETFRFNYCHNSCHTNVTCYNSRGRR